MNLSALPWYYFIWFELYFREISYAKHRRLRVWKQWNQWSDTWPFAIFLNINLAFAVHIGGSTEMCALLFNKWGGGSKIEFENLPSRSFFFFPKPSRRCRSRPPKSKNFRMLRSIVIIITSCSCCPNCSCFVSVCRLPVASITPFCWQLMVKCFHAAGVQMDKLVRLWHIKMVWWTVL